MRHLLALFPVDRADLDRHAATIASHFADADNRWTALIIFSSCVCLAATVAGILIIAAEQL